jgi:uncharacterized protein with HEPN domain
MPPDESVLSPDDVIRLRHISDAAAMIESALTGKDAASFDRDPILLLAIVKCLENIGEAARQLSPAGQGALPGIPWSRVVGMRNHLVHVDFDIDQQIVWDTATREVPQLAARIAAKLAEGSDAPV